MKSDIIRRLCALVAASSLLFAACAKSAAGGAPAANGTGAAGSNGQAAGAGGQAGGAGGGAQAGQRGARRSTIVPVQAMSVQVGFLGTDRTSAGVVGPSVQSLVASQVSGVVLRVPRKVGDWVKEGDVVVQLDDSQLKLSQATAEAALANANINLSMGQDNSSQANPKLRLQLQSAQSALDSAQKYYDSQKALYDLGGISASALDTAKSQLTAAQANVEGAKTALDQNGKADDWTIAQLKIAVTQAQAQADQARLNLRNASIRAPFSGQIAAINMQPGMYVGLNTPVFTLVSSSKQVNFNVPPSDAPFLRLGTDLKFSYNGKDYPVKVVQAPAAPISGVVPMVASAVSLAALPFGSVGNMVYRVTLSQGALVPLAALATLENQTYVFAIQDGRAIIKNVSIIAEAGTTAAVGGIQAGDVVVVSPPPGLIQGSQVQATMLQSGGGQPSQAPKKGGSSGAAQGATP